MADEAGNTNSEKRVSEKSGFADRVKSLFTDMALLSIGVLCLCIVLAIVVCLFRFLDMGHAIVFAVSACSDVLAAAAWPLLVAVSVVLYRRHVLEALKEIPGFIRNYPSKNPVSPAANSRDDGCDADGAGTSPTKHRPNERTHAVQNISKGRGRMPPGSSSEVGFRNYVLDTLQRESGVFVLREVNLFSDRTYRFDGAMVRGERITGIEVLNGDEVSCHERALLRIERFWQGISKADRTVFDLVCCVRGERDALLPMLERVREKLSFPVEFRFFKFGGSGFVEKE